jgi:hypothetical protein
MTPWRTATLAIGSSFFGSTLYLVIKEKNLIAIILLAFGVLLLFHSIGWIQKLIFLSFICMRKNFPKIGILNYMVWDFDPENGTVGWVYTKKDPNEIKNDLNQFFKNIKSKPIKINNDWQKWFMSRYSAIINPYGSIFPVTSIEKLDTWDPIRNYVYNGGLWFNVADIPFYWAYDIRKKIRQEQLNYTYPAIYEERYLNQNKKILYPFSVTNFGPFSETLFAKELRLKLINIENISNNLKGFKFMDIDIPPNFLKRAVLSTWYNPAISDWVRDNKIINKLDGNIEIEVDENHKGVPIFSIQYGKGKFLISLLCFDEAVDDKEHQKIYECYYKLLNEEL